MKVRWAARIRRGPAAAWHKGRAVSVGADGLLDPVVCQAAAAGLCGEPVGDANMEDRAIRLLVALDYRPDEDRGDHDGTRNRAALLRLAGRFQRLFPIAPPDSPHLVFVGGEVLPGEVGPGHEDEGPVSTAGSGLAFAQAFERCVGEGAEFLSQIEAADDIVDCGHPADVPHGLESDALSAMQAMLPQANGRNPSALDWVAGRRLGDARPVLLPADLCLRRMRAANGPAPLVSVGTGCAAGPTIEAATISALLEAIERDAAALWWSGGRPACPLSLEAGAAAGAEAFLAQLRGGMATRHSRLLDITTDLGVPSIAAVSMDPGGGGFACGLAAGTTLGSAVRSAMVELCQMELSHQIIALKRRQRGDAALNAHDLAHLERGRAIGAGHPIIQPRGAARDWLDGETRTAGAAIGLDDLLDRLASAGAQAFAVDCTRQDLAIPVVKVVAAGLQPYPSKIVTPRLKHNFDDRLPDPGVALL